MPERQWSKFLLAPPALSLIAVNTIPLLGVLLWGWTLFEVVVLYWFENVVIGAINVLKIITCAPDEDHLRMAAARASADGNAAGQPAANGQQMTAAAHHAIKLFFVPFFTFHYGMFCFVHGIFVFALLGNKDAFLAGGGPFSTLSQMVAQLFSGGMLLAAAALILSHLFSYLFHFLLRGEYRRTNVGKLMVAPYARVVVLHIAILFGAFATFLLGQPIILVTLLIGGKTFLDLAMHAQSHGKHQPETAGQ